MEQALAQLALTGTLDALGAAGGPPQLPANLVADFLYAVIDPRVRLS